MIMRVNDQAPDSRLLVEKFHISTGSKGFFSGMYRGFGFLGVSGDSYRVLGVPVLLAPTCVEGTSSEVIMLRCHIWDFI